MYRKVTFYTTLDGKCPVAEFIDCWDFSIMETL